MRYASLQWQLYCLVVLDENKYSMKQKQGITKICNSYSHHAFLKSVKHQSKTDNRWYDLFYQSESKVCCIVLSEFCWTHLCVSYKVGNGNIAIHFWHGVEYIPLDILCYYNPVTHYQLNIVNIWRYWFVGIKYFSTPLQGNSRNNEKEINRK